MNQYHYNALLSPMARDTARAGIFQRLRRYMPNLKMERMDALLTHGNFLFTVAGEIV